MNGNVLHIHKNIRYRIITVNGKHYIFDLDRPFLVFFFPFLNWMKPHTVYKITDTDKFEQLIVAKSKPRVRFGLAMFTGGLSIFLANLLELVMDKFEMSTPNIVSFIFLIFFTTLIISYRFHVSRRNKIKLYNIVHLDRLEKKKVHFGPQNIKHFCLLLLLYSGFLAFGLAGMIMFIQYKNFLILFFTILLLFCLLFINGISLFPGKNKIRIKEM